MDPRELAREPGRDVMPQHGDQDRCVRCGGTVEFWEHTQSTGLDTYETLDWGWSHRKHPADGHDARVAPRTVNDGQTDSCWICSAPGNHALQRHGDHGRDTGDGLTRRDILEYLAAYR